MKSGEPIPADTRSRSLRENVVWTLLGNGCYAASQWGMLMLLSKASSPETVGRFALGLALTAPVIMLANLQLRSVLATDARGEHPFRRYAALRLWCSAAAMAVMTAIALFAGYDREVAAVVLLIGGGKVVESWSDIYLGYLQRRERMDRVSRSLLIKSALFLAAFWFGVKLGGLIPAVALLAAARLAAFLLIDAPEVVRLGGGREIRPRGRWRDLKGLAWTALPLGLATMLSSLQTNIPRYFIEHFRSAADLGVFAAMSYLLVVGGLVVNALGQSASPRLANHFASGETAAFRRLLLRMVGIGLGLGAAGVAVAALAGRQLLSLLYTAEYSREIDLFILLAVISGLVYASIFFGTALNAMRRFAVKMPLQAIGAALLTVMCRLLVPGQGMRGAVLAMLVSTLAMALAQAAVTLFFMRRGPGPAARGG